MKFINSLIRVFRLYWIGILVFAILNIFVFRVLNLTGFEYYFWHMIAITIEAVTIAGLKQKYLNKGK